MHVLAGTLDAAHSQCIHDVHQEAQQRLSTRTKVLSRPARAAAARGGCAWGSVHPGWPAVWRGVLTLPPCLRRACSTPGARFWTNWTLCACPCRCVHADVSMLLHGPLSAPTSPASKAWDRTPLPRPARMARPCVSHSFPWVAPACSKDALRSATAAPPGVDLVLPRRACSCLMLPWVPAKRPSRRSRQQPPATRWCWWCCQSTAGWRPAYCPACCTGATTCAASQCACCPGCRWGGAAAGGMQAERAGCRG